MKFSRLRGRRASDNNNSELPSSSSSSNHPQSHHHHQHSPLSGSLNGGNTDTRHPNSTDSNSSNTQFTYPESSGNQASELHINHHQEDDDIDDDEQEDQNNSQLQKAFEFEEGEEDANEDDGEEPTVKDVQEAINIRHPFGLRLWKPALYKKQRSIAAATYEALHADPNVLPDRKFFLSLGNIAWLLACGWWMCLVYLAVALLGLAPLALLGSFAKNAVCCCCGKSRASGMPRGKGCLPYELFVELEALWDYARVLVNLSTYVLWPFGKYIAKSRTETGSTSNSYFHSHDAGNERSGLLSGHSGHEPEIPATRRSNIVNNARPRGPSEPHSPFLKRKNKRTPISDDAAEYLEDNVLGTDPLLNRPITSGNFLRKIWQTSVTDWLFPRAIKRAWQSGIRGMIFFAFLILIIAPIHMAVSALCWFCVVSIPMAKLNYVLLKHLLRHPLKLSAYPVSHFRKPPSVALRSSNTGNDNNANDDGFAISPISIRQRPNSMLFFSRVSDTFIHEANEAGEDYDRGYDVVLCTYRAIGLQYYKYTFDGINIILINLLGVVAFVLADFYLIAPHTNPPFSGVASHSLLFFCSIVSVVPLAYMIGMAVSSITARSGSLALGAVVNATFGSIVEVVLYALALINGKTKMVEGSLVGSLLCGVLLLPAVSMVSGGIKRKEHRFNAKAAGVTSTMLIVSLIAAFAPTIFQEIYGTFELRCSACPSTASTLNVVVKETAGLTCRQCTYSQPHPTLDPVYKSRTKPLMYACAFALVLTYMVGLWFTLRTHSAHIYPPSKKKNRRRDRNKWVERPHHPSMLQSPTLVTPVEANASGIMHHQTSTSPDAAQKKPWKRGTISRGRKLPTSIIVGPQSLPPPLASADLLASTESHPNASINPAATRPPSFPIMPLAVNVRPDPPILLDEISSACDSDDSEEEHVGGGHNAPNWSQLKSCIVLVTATVAFSLIADVLIDSVDVILKDFQIDEKFLGLTLFSLVPTVTEFYNAIAFALQGNIALSLEIGSAYAAQVALIQIPAIVFFSYLYPALIGPFPKSPAGLDNGQESADGEGGFTLIFPRWDFYTVLFGVFILSYIYIEGKSNYFKGAMLGVAYFVVMVGFYYVPSGGEGSTTTMFI